MKARRVCSFPADVSQADRTIDSDCHRAIVIDSGDRQIDTEGERYVIKAPAAQNDIDDIDFFRRSHVIAS